MSRKPRKPRLTPAECRYFDEVHRMDIKWGRHHSSLEQAFCDVHDGGLYECEVEPLIRKKLLTKVPMEKCDMREGRLLGCRWSVFLTNYGMSVFWPRLFRKRQAAVVHRATPRRDPRPDRRIP